MRRQVINSIYGKLKLEQLIGRGSYGQIYKATSTNKQSSTHNLAVKIIISDSDPDSLPNIEKQIKILMSCQHQNIVKCYSVEIVEDSVWIVMEFCELGSLTDVMKANKRTFTQLQIKCYLKGILRALEYLHENLIMHRDIKAANVLLMADGQVKVADFGVSTLMSQTKMGRNTRTGSPFWMSPQLLSKSQYTFKTDVWSLGITAIELAEGAPPYSYQHPYRAIFSIQSRPPQSLTDPQKWSPQFNDFVKQCLTLNQNRRPSAYELLSHPFIQSSPENSCLQIQTSDPFQNRSSSSLYRQSITFHQNPYPMNEQIEQNNFGTMIINDDIQQSNQNNGYSHLWGQISTSERNSLCYRATSNYQNTNQNTNQIPQIQEDVGGTFKINENQDHFRVNPLILKTFNSNNFNTNYQDNSHHGSYKHQQKHQGSLQSVSSGDIDKIQSLYAEMEVEIARIKMKYLKKIKQIEEINLPTFQQQIKNQRNSQLTETGFSKNKHNKENIIQ